MTTAHRPTWVAAKGTGSEAGSWSTGGQASRAVSSWDLPSQTTLKFRKTGQNSEAELRTRDIRGEVDDAEHRELDNRPAENTRRYEEGGAGRGRERLQLLLKEQKEVDLERVKKYDDADDADSGEDLESSDSDDNSEDDEEALERELEKIRKEREETRKKRDILLGCWYSRTPKDAELEAIDNTNRFGSMISWEWKRKNPSEGDEEGVRKPYDVVLTRDIEIFREYSQEREEAEIEEKRKQEAAMTGNILLTQSSTSQVKRRWNDDVVFKGQARTEPEQKKRFVNDTIRNDFHRRFLTKYIK